MTPPTPIASRIGPAIGVVGLGIAAAGLFALPIQSFDFVKEQDVGFVQIHQLAGYLADHPLNGREAPMGGFAQFWWQWGLFLAGAVLVALLAAAVLGRIPALSWVLAGVAALTGVLHGIAVNQTGDYASLLRFLRARGSLYDHAGSGTWVAFGGLAVLAIAGVLCALTARARTGATQQPPPAPA